jgi:hypothetical protein
MGQIGLSMKLRNPVSEDEEVPASLQVSNTPSCQRFPMEGKVREKEII